MSLDPETERNAILRVVNKINESWLAKNYDDLGSCLDENVIMAAPGSSNRLKGRTAYVQSFRDYDTVAKTLQINFEEILIDIIGDTAAAVCPFEVTYELKGKTYHERGSDILILTRKDSEWLVVWRTMQSEPA
jgi:hypothetical protein